MHALQLEVMAIILAGSLSVAHDAPMDDAEIRSKMYGTCIQHDQFDSGVSMNRIYTYSADGTFTDRGERTEGSRVNHFTVAGTWRIDNGKIYYEVRSSTHPGVPPGYKNVNRIASIDQETVAMDTPQGRRVVCRWKK